MLLAATPDRRFQNKHSIVLSSPIECKSILLKQSSCSLAMASLGSNDNNGNNKYYFWSQSLSQKAGKEFYYLQSSKQIWRILSLFLLYIMWKSPLFYYKNVWDENVHVHCTKRIVTWWKNFPILSSSALHPSWSEQDWFLFLALVLTHPFDFSDVWQGFT